MLNKTNLLLTIAVLVLVVINLSLYIDKILTPTLKNDEIKKQYETEVTQNEQNQITDDDSYALTDEEMEQEELINLKSMGEEERMYVYFHKYMLFIESGKYEEAYNWLYEDFKNQYFPTVDKFKEYVQQLYPKFIATEYKGIERQGEYYILTVAITDEIEVEHVETLMQKFVIHEKGFNDIELSFQVL